METQSEILWQGKYTTVFKCKWNKKSIALKRIKLEDVGVNDFESDAITFLKVANHENNRQEIDKTYKYK